MTKERKQEIIATYKREENDTGSPEVQIALLTERINELTEHLKANTKDFKLTPSTKGLTLSFYCAETERDYKFTKPITLSTDLDMEINPDWTDENYKVAIKFSKINF